MYKRAVSGQFIGFAMISAFSGTPLTGLSGFLSGYKSIDGSGQIGISGNIVEKAFGQYVCNLYDWDCSGNNISYYFLGASGAIPVEKTVVTMDATSGVIALASGSLVSGIIASGIVFPSSGAFANVPLATLSGLQPISGTFVSVPIASISGAIANSGLFVTVPVATVSGVFVASGCLSGQLLNVLSGQMSGQVVDLNSGRSFTASGINAAVPISSISGVQPVSGTFVSVPISSISGVTANSGLNVIAGTVNDKSGYTLSASGLDTIRVESGVNMRQAQAPMLAALAGRLSGAGTTSILIDGGNVSGTNRINATVDASGNRTAVSLTLPT